MEKALLGKALCVCMASLILPCLLPFSQSQDLAFLDMLLISSPPGLFYMEFE